MVFDHLLVILQSIIVAIPLALVLEWESYNKKKLQREPHVIERVAIIAIATGVTIYAVFLLFHNRTIFGHQFKSPIHLD